MTVSHAELVNARIDNADGFDHPTPHRQ